MESTEKRPGLDILRKAGNLTAWLIAIDFILLTACMVKYLAS